MYKGKTVSLVLPAYNEEKNIQKSIDEFKKTKVVDEILVINNNSSDNTEVLAKKSGAKVVNEIKQGYGFALRRGMKEAKGDLVVLCEPDGTFDATDITLLLDKTNDYDLVMGTRTNNKFIRKGANMGAFLRIGNIAVAKFMQALYGLGNTTDCGCTFRAFRKERLKKILPYLTVGGSHLLPETVVMIKISGGKILEIPVHYGERVGKSKITGSFTRAVKVGLNMVNIIVKNRIKPPKLS